MLPSFHECSNLFHHRLRHNPPLSNTFPSYIKAALIPSTSSIRISTITTLSSPPSFRIESPQIRHQHVSQALPSHLPLHFHWCQHRGSKCKGTEYRHQPHSHSRGGGLNKQMCFVSTYSDHLRHIAESVVKGER